MSRGKKSKVVEIPLDVCLKGRKISCVGGALPYLWIGDDNCFGCVPDSQVERLRDLCNLILTAKKEGKALSL